MDDALVDALLVAAEDGGVDCDGLVATVDDSDGYVFAAGDERHHGVDEERFRELAREHPRYVGNWRFWAQETPPGDDRVAFLRWLEGAEDEPLPDRLNRLEDGVETTWGQLHVTVTLADSGAAAPASQYHRQYTLRHAEDVHGEAPVDSADLTDHTDPLDARELSKHDDRNRYRPLKTAPTLQRGWRFPDLDPSALVRAVECFYPATIPNWHREREGDLDVDHWRDTAERQTGIYDVVEELPREAVEWVAEACCVDSQCTKRREWQYDEGEALEADGGDGTYPCREPCSLVVAAARKWTILEGETERTYEFDLTPSEKHQLEELIDAVADGRVDEIREADVGDGANRYRARYLRAKRFDDEGNLCGVPTTDGDE
ncbi:hypothetical protein L593_00025 [Salinarchaeum sp. Harcht-Bsk1]|uniref:DR2241 family protein n=1 Tax=Salinarchaeum sp. Harcht-Bsk1 TaxID=1333523 RepID=UPI0003422A58|nr:DR2241 family protein [Salinarchaeum sp. Harcht-Bsk1]AGM99959.1 hypothetical protein L593_00025 [Salinarchaeum sp. Harcht-Bsk1]